MSTYNVEIKARTTRTEAIRTFLLNRGAMYKGTDLQEDIYFNVRDGRLKLRRGNIENNLIWYRRENETGPKQSDYRLLPVAQGDLLFEMLSGALGIKVAVKKKREIYYIQNVKFHLDELEGMGSFVEIEASSQSNALSREELLKQVEYYMEAFQVQPGDLIDVSYSDLLLHQPGS